MLWTAPSVTHKPLEKKEIHHIDLGWVKMTQTATGVIGSTWFGSMTEADMQSCTMGTRQNRICPQTANISATKFTLHFIVIFPSLCCPMFSLKESFCACWRAISADHPQHKPIRQKCGFAPVTLDLSKPGPPTVSFLIKSNTFLSNILK